MNTTAFVDVNKYSQQIGQLARRDEFWHLWCSREARETQASQVSQWKLSEIVFVRVMEAVVGNGRRLDVPCSILAMASCQTEVLGTAVVRDMETMMQAMRSTLAVLLVMAFWPKRSQNFRSCHFRALSTNGKRSNENFVKFPIFLFTAV